MVFTRAQRQRKQMEDNGVGAKTYFSAKRKVDEEHVKARKRLKRKCRIRNTRQGTHVWEEDSNSENGDFDGENFGEVDTDGDHPWDEASDAESDPASPWTSMGDTQTQLDYIGAFQAQDVGIIKPQGAGLATPLSRLQFANTTARSHSTRSSFRDLPAEILQSIADYLPSDKDALNLSMVTKRARDMINNRLYWRLRFENLFDHVKAKGLSNAENDKLGDERSTQYMYRQHISRSWTLFENLNLVQYGLSPRTIYSEAYSFRLMNCTEVVRSLIAESDGKTGKNIKFFQDWISRPDSGRPPLDILDAVFKIGFEANNTLQTSSRETTSISKMRKFSKFGNWPSVEVKTQGVLHTIQLCLTPLSFDTKYSDIRLRPIANFDVSQWVAYALDNVCAGFQGTRKEKVNVEMYLHIVNFFKYHCKTRSEGIVEHMFRGLPKDQVPKLWPGRLTGQTQTLRPYWKGVTTYLSQHELIRCRNIWGSEHNEMFYDNYESNETFHDIGMFFDKKIMNSGTFPEIYNTMLNTNPFLKDKLPEENMKELPGVEYFWGTTRNKGLTNSHFLGGLHVVPAQHNLVGFQRITFVLFITILENGIEVYDPDRVWLYEGLVLPGGTMIVGRWYSHHAYLGGAPGWDACQAGPFLWWNVDRCGNAIPINAEEALDFFDSFQFN